jgi:hypothetical protein
MILGESGTGKTASLRGLTPDQVLLIQIVKKPLPFKSTTWTAINKTGGSIFHTDASEVQRNRASRLGCVNGCR